MYEQFKGKDLTLRDRLAMDRTKLANERTFLAYARTAIMLFVTGFSLYKLFPSSFEAKTLGLVLFFTGVLVTAIGIRGFVQRRQSLAHFSDRHVEDKSE